MSGKRENRNADVESKRTWGKRRHWLGVILLLGLGLRVGAPALAQDTTMGEDRPCGQYNAFPWVCPPPDLGMNGTGSWQPPVDGTEDTPPCNADNQCCVVENGAEGSNPVDLWNGREFFTHTDLVVPGLMDIAIRRSYDSRAGYDSALGYGWALNYFIRLYEYADESVILRRDCGLRRSFYYEAGAYQTPVGETGTLVKHGDGSWTYTEKSGDHFEFDADGKLTAIVSVHGPSLTFEYDTRGKLPLIGLSPYAVDPQSTLEVSQDFRLTRINEKDGAGQTTGRWVELTYDEDTGRLTTVSDSAGRTVQYVHDDVGNLEQVVLPENEIQTYLYEDPNDPHNATTMTHRGCSSCGTGTTINTYDTQDRVIRQERGLQVHTFSYDIPYVQTSYTVETYDDQGAPLHTAMRTVEFNEFGNPILKEDPLGNQAIYVRDSRMNIIRKEIWEDQGGPELVLVYAEEKTFDARDNALTYTEAVGFPEERMTTYTYDTYGRLETITVPSVVDPQQNKLTTFAYDGSNNLLTRTEQGFLGDGSPFTYTTTYAYDSNGQVLTIDGPRTDVTDVTTYAYDPQGNLSSVTQPLNLITSYSDHTAGGQPETVTDPNGIPTTYTYDSLGRVTTVTVDGDTTSYTYTTTGKIEQITLPRLNTVTYAYDSRDRLVTITDGLGNTINYTYDSSGNRLSEDIKDPQGTLTKTVSYQYDVLGRVYRINNPDTNYWEFSYDAMGNRLSSKDPKGNPLTYFHYDPLRRLEEVVQPGDIHTLYGYDSHNNLVSLTVGNGTSTTFILDDMRRLYQEISPDTGTTTYQYDPAGNMVSKTDARGITVNYSYDALNRRTLSDFPTDIDIVYTYDNCTYGKGRLCRVVDQAGTTDYTYSPKGELAQEDKLILGVNYTTGYQYDANGNVELLAYPSGRTVTYVYDNADQVTSVLTTPPGGVEQTVASALFYHPFGNEASMIYGNGLARNVGYDLQYRVTSIQTAAVHDVSYIPDPNGNIQQITDNLDSNRNKSFSYDALNRLEGATGPWGNLSWSYDNIGNRLAHTDAAGTTNYTYYAGTNRLEALTGATTATFTFGATGDVETEGTRQYIYNENDRLAQVNDSGSLVEYQYNAAGQRIVRTVDAVSTVFLSFPTGQLITEAASSGTSIADYIYLAGRPIAKAESSSIFYVDTDHLGTPKNMTNVNGQSVWEIETRPFGDGATITGTESLSLRFPGQYYDEETGLNQNWHRDYSSVLGRYMQADPLADLRHPHSYFYADNLPVSRTDPRGLQSGPVGPPPPFVWPPPAPEVPNMPGPKPGPQCCDSAKREARKKFVQEGLDTMDKGELPTGGVASSQERSWSCNPTSGRCEPFPEDPNNFNPPMPEEKDPCIRYCIRYHEWVHSTDSRPRASYWRPTDNDRHMEQPAWKGELKCLNSYP